MMNIRVLDEPDARQYQELRLKALKLSPEAFGSTYEKAHFPLETYVERIRHTQEKFTLGTLMRTARL